MYIYIYIYIYIYMHRHKTHTCIIDIGLVLFPFDATSGRILSA